MPHAVPLVGMTRNNDRPARVFHRKKSTKMRPIARRNRAKVLTEIAKSLKWEKTNAVPDDEAMRRPRDMMTAL